jgi:hypothetical protein
VSYVEGPVTDDDVFHHSTRMAADPLFDPGFDHLVDTTLIGDVHITSQCIRTVAGMSPFSAGSHRAFVTNKPVVTGLVRMFELSQQRSSHIRLFRSIAEARQWLDECRQNAGSSGSASPVATDAKAR